MYIGRVHVYHVQVRPLPGVGGSFSSIQCTFVVNLREIFINVDFCERKDYLGPFLDPLRIWHAISEQALGKYPKSGAPLLTNLSWQSISQVGAQYLKYTEDNLSHLSPLLNRFKIFKVPIKIDRPSIVPQLFEAAVILDHLCRKDDLFII